MMYIVRFKDEFGDVYDTFERGALDAAIAFGEDEVEYGDASSFDVYSEDYEERLYDSSVDGLSSERAGMRKNAQETWDIDLVDNSTNRACWAEVFENADGEWGWEVSSNDGYVDSQFGYSTPDEACDALVDDGRWRAIEATRKSAQELTPDGWEFNEYENIWEKLYDGDLYGEVIDGYGYTLYQADGVDGDVLSSGGSPDPYEAMKTCDEEADTWLGNGGSWIGSRTAADRGDKLQALYSDYVTEFPSLSEVEKDAVGDFLDWLYATGRKAVRKANRKGAGLDLAGWDEQSDGSWFWEGWDMNAEAVPINDGTGDYEVTVYYDAVDGVYTKSLVDYGNDFMQVADYLVDIIDSVAAHNAMRKRALTLTEYPEGWDDSDPNAPFDAYRRYSNGFEAYIYDDGTWDLFDQDGALYAQSEGIEDCFECAVRIDNIMDEDVFEIASRSKTADWQRGIVTVDGVEYEYEAKVYDEGSEYGIDGGPVSKLHCHVNGTGWGSELFAYEREWDIMPSETGSEDVFDAVMEAIGA